MILSPEYIDWVNASPDLDFLSFVKTEFLSHLPSFKFFDPPGHLIEDMVRVKLTQNLAKLIVPISDEASLSFDDIWGKSPDWTETTLKSDMLTLISRLSAVVFTGGELSHSVEWQKITVEVTVNGFLGVVECRSFPRALQHLVSLFMPHAVRARTNLQRGKALIQQILDRRAREQQEGLSTNTPAPKYSDAISWLDELAATGKYPKSDPAQLQLSLAMAAIHTSTDLLTQTLYNICAYPELVQPLREEIIRVIGASGWTKQALQELRLMDSLLKETQRIQASGGLVMNRVALADVDLPGGVRIKKGQHIAVSTHLMKDPNFYDNPSKFDPYRFAKRREDPALANKSHLVSTSIEHTGFSHGRHACPGRFFAANEIKIALVHLLIKYDIELVAASAPQPLRFGVNTSSNSTAKIRMRRRKEDVAL